MWRYSLCFIAVVGAYVASAPQAEATTECTTSLSRVYSGDDGTIWLILSNGGSAYLTSTDPDKDATTAIAITALSTGRTITVRYSADAVSCTSVNRSDVVGVYLNG